LSASSIKEQGSVAMASAPSPLRETASIGTAALRSQIAKLHASVVVHRLVPDGYLVTQKRSKGSARLDPAQVQILKLWMADSRHWTHPYPSEAEKQCLAEQTSLKLSQVSDWFRNERKRTWLPLTRLEGSELGSLVAARGTQAGHHHVRDTASGRVRRIAGSASLVSPLLSAMA
jgi:hypothetical protein